MAGKAKFVRKEKFSLPREKNNVKGRNIIRNGDARLKIIQKNRSKFVDARDRLAQMAKKTDARAKILKLRQGREGVSTFNTQSVRPVGSSILLKTDRNGKISLSTNKTKKKSAPSDINAAVRKELGLLGNPRNRMIRQIQRSNESAMYRAPVRPINVGIDGYSRDAEMANAFTPPVIKRTIRNDAIREMIPLQEFPPCRPLESNLYTWVRPLPGRTLSGPASIPGQESLGQPIDVTGRNNFVIESVNDWAYGEPPSRSIKLSSMFTDEDMEDNSLQTSTVAQRLKTGVHARLDTPISTTHSQGIFAHTKTKVVVPVGHRIVVSNLQSTVTKDDIRELFEDIGELLVSRLVRPGTAEVIYKNLKDAQKAVDTYHNRQLDGQPMKCLLVNKRPINNPTAPAVRTTKTTSSVLRTTNGVTKKTVPVVKSTSVKLVPDISTIHKVLFHKT
ncbi:uncharacterized protein CBL_00338 [Carabus blaptoides fortunei]